MTDLKVQYTYFPKDITLIIPTHTTLPPENLHFLIYIPWQESYFDLIPPEYQDFYREILPHSLPYDLG